MKKTAKTGVDEDWKDFKKLRNRINSILKKKNVHVSPAGWKTAHPQVTHGGQ